MRQLISDFNDIRTQIAIVGAQSDRDLGLLTSAYKSGERALMEVLREKLDRVSLSGEVGYWRLKDDQLALALRSIGISELSRRLKVRRYERGSLEHVIQDIVLQLGQWNFGHLLRVHPRSLVVRACGILSGTVDGLPVAAELDLLDRQARVFEWCDRSAPERLFGRLSEARRLASFISHVEKGGSGALLQVIGDAGYGKTSLVASGLKSLVREGGGYAVIDFEEPSPYSDYRASVAERLVQSVVAFANRRYAIDPADLLTNENLLLRRGARTPSQIGALLPHMAAMFPHLAKNWVVVFDSVEMYFGNHEGLADFKRFALDLARELSGWKIVVVSRERVFEADDLVTTIHLKPLIQKDAEDLLMFRLSSAPLTPVQVGELLSIVPRYNPSLILLLADFANSWGYPTRTPDEWLRFEAEFDEEAFKAYVYERIVRKIHDPVLRLLSLLCAGLRRINADVVVKVVLPFVKSAYADQAEDSNKRDLRILIDEYFSSQFAEHEINALADVGIDEVRRLLSGLAGQVIFTESFNQDLIVRSDLRSCVAKFSTPAYKSLWLELARYAHNKKPQRPEDRLDAFYYNAIVDPATTHYLEATFYRNGQRALNKYVPIFSPRVSAWYKARTGQLWTVRELRSCFPQDWDKYALETMESGALCGEYALFKDAFLSHASGAKIPAKDQFNVLTAIGHIREARFAEAISVLRDDIKDGSASTSPHATGFWFCLALVMSGSLRHKPDRLARELRVSLAEEVRDNLSKIAQPDENADRLRRIFCERVVAHILDQEPESPRRAQWSVVLLNSDRLTYRHNANVPAICAACECIIALGFDPDAYKYYINEELLRIPEEAQSELIGLVLSDAAKAGGAAGAATMPLRKQKGLDLERRVNLFRMNCADANVFDCLSKATRVRIQKIFFDNETAVQALLMLGGEESFKDGALAKDLLHNLRLGKATRATLPDVLEAKQRKQWTEGMQQLVKFVAS